MLKDTILNLIYPRHCPICHEILENQKAYTCHKCKNRIKPIRGTICMKCGRPVEREEEYCVDCRKGKHSFTEGRGIFLYDDTWKNSLMHYKYFGCKEYSEFYGRAVSFFAKNELSRWNVDLMIPVPLHSSKRRQRGYNQSEILAQQIEKYINIPLDCNLVKKIKATKSQKKLSAEQRKQNLKDVFEVKRRLKGETILIIDDVYTTGSTMDAIAEVLKENGAGNIYFLTICIAQR